MIREKKESSARRWQSGRRRCTHKIRGNHCVLRVLGGSVWRRRRGTSGTEGAWERRGWWVMSRHKTTQASHFTRVGISCFGGTRCKKVNVFLTSHVLLTLASTHTLIHSHSRPPLTHTLRGVLRNASKETSIQGSDTILKST